MGTLEHHKSKAETHQKSADTITEEMADLLSWKVVIRFYTALHLLDAYLSTKNIHPESHSERSRELNKNSELSQARGKNFKKAYNRLKSISEQIRYDVSYPFCDTDLKISGTDLATVRSFLSNRI